MVSRRIGKRLTNYDDDMERLAENLWRAKGQSIVDKSSFNLALSQYIDKDLTSKQKSLMSKSVWDTLQSKKPRLREEKQISRVDVTYKAKTTPTRKTITASKPKKEFKFVKTGFIKGRRVFVRPSRVIIRGKTVLRFIDKKGRFTKTKK